MDAYKQAKLSNRYTDLISTSIDERNANSVTFNSWYNQFSTVRTLLNGRKDVEVFYWIDGLGIDWDSVYYATCGAIQKRGHLS